MCCYAARANEQGEGLPPGAPCGVACGQALQPCGLSGGLPTGSRLRRACTPFLIEKFPGIPKPKSTTIRAHSRAYSPGCVSTYLSGNAVQTNRATSKHLQAANTNAQCASSPLRDEALRIEERTANKRQAQETTVRSFQNFFLGAHPLHRSCADSSVPVPLTQQQAPGVTVTESTIASRRKLSRSRRPFHIMQFSRPFS